MDPPKTEKRLENSTHYIQMSRKEQNKKRPPGGNGSLVGGDPRAHIHPPKLLGADSLHATPVENDLDGRFSDGGDWTHPKPRHIDF